MKEYRSNLIFASVIFCTLALLVSLPVMAETNHSANIAATLCDAIDGTLQLDGVAESWAKETKGQNPSVKITMKVVYANNSVNEWQIADAPFQPPSYAFDFGYQGLPNNVKAVFASYYVSGQWGDGAKGGQTESIQAVRTGDCVAKTTPTAEPHTATPTSTPTATPTVTATPTFTATPTEVWDRSSLSVVGMCNTGIPTFIVRNTGQAMRDASLWTLYVGEEIFEQGFVQLDAGQNMQKVFPGKTGKLRFTAEQASGHPGDALPQATVDADSCAAPTSDEEVKEPLDITIEKVESASSPTTAVYFVQCLPVSPGNKDIMIEIFVTFNDGALGEVRKGKYCNSNIYINGAVDLVQLVGAVADSKEAFGATIYLPVVAR